MVDGVVGGVGGEGEEEVVLVSMLGRMAMASGCTCARRPRGGDRSRGGLDRGGCRPGR